MVQRTLAGRLAALEDREGRQITLELARTGMFAQVTQQAAVLLADLEMNEKMMPWNCDHCGKQLFESEFVEQKGDMLVYRCRDCERETVVLVVIAPLAKRVDE
jgi:hypothetical protein